ncbi:hypothetical protein B296_00037157 [Ensete ventricosum]|uniref:Uncharacterized protein n=1 Tax=Ensete ventricosum TaxID=4639 RepID=A0A426YXA8_ENSVE|nr:hypothetical protein B296_00037157 [Ensete ventricosum]
MLRVIGLCTARPTSTVLYRAAPLHAFSDGCTLCDAVPHNPGQPGYGLLLCMSPRCHGGTEVPGYGLLLCMSSRCHGGTDAATVLMPRG